AFTLAIVGRPNVGKSTLFNRLVGKRQAIVDDMPGVTRDRREGKGRLADLAFTVEDTAGFEDVQGEALLARMRAQTEQAVATADAVLLVVDAREGVTALDQSFARALRKSEARVLLVANKCEGRGGEAGRMEAFRLGFGEPIPVSAEHGEGMGDLYDALAPLIHAKAEATHAPEEEDAPGAEVEEEASDEDSGEPAARGPRAIQLAVVGRPNVGKSTLVNRLIGEDRLLTGPEAGITRDAIAVEWTHSGRALRLVDTAGLRRRAKVVDKLEWLSGEDTKRAIQFAEVVILVLDSTDLLEKQDLYIARQVEEEGRALVLAVNKWDLVEDTKAALAKLERRLEISLPQSRGLPVIPLSAKTGKGLERLLDTAIEMVDIWSRRIPTPALNRWLQAMEDAHLPPLVKGRRLKLRYMSQAKSRPPTFNLFCNLPEAMADSYQRYLVNGLRDAFDMPGIPIRFVLRRSENPYVGKSRRGKPTVDKSHSAKPSKGKSPTGHSKSVKPGGSKPGVGKSPSGKAGGKAKAGKASAGKARSGKSRARRAGF
ncbi:MAG: ribosome biogenesis GTPase Der, partial [Dongiales bacterium]